LTKSASLVQTDIDDIKWVYAQSLANIHDMRSRGTVPSPEAQNLVFKYEKGEISMFDLAVSVGLNEFGEVFVKKTKENKIKVEALAFLRVSMIPTLGEPEAHVPPVRVEDPNALRRRMERALEPEEPIDAFPDVFVDEEP
jgi:hypothetical protein